LLIKEKKSLVAMESCGGTHYWTRFAKQAGHHVKSINVRQVKAFRQGQKTDAKLLTKNLVACAIQDAKRKIKKPKNNRIYEYKINFTFAINQLKDNVIRFIMRLAELELYELLISKISKNLSVNRPDRKFFRQDRRNKTNKYPMNYKRMC
jgi:hypothetical protein